MSTTRRNLLGIALLGTTGPLLAAVPRLSVVAARLDAALAAIAHCTGEPFWGKRPTMVRNMSSGYARSSYIHWPGAGPTSKLLCMFMISEQGCNK